MTQQDEIKIILRTFAGRRNLVDIVEDVTYELRIYETEEILTALVEALNDPEDQTRLLSIWLLREKWTDAETALPSVINSIKDSYRTVRLAAANLVAKYTEKAKPAIPILMEWIGSKDRLTHVSALGNILLIDPSMKENLLPVLIDELESEDGKAQIEAIWQLDRLGELASDVVPKLKNLLNAHSTVSMSASDAILSITGDPTDSIKVGLDLLDHDEWLQRLCGAEHLRLLGSKARSTVPHLQLVLENDENEAVRNEAERALGEIEGD